MLVLSFIYLCLFCPRSINHKGPIRLRMAGDKSMLFWNQYGSVHMKRLLKTTKQDLLALVQNCITSTCGSKRFGLSIPVLSRLSA